MPRPDRIFRLLVEQIRRQVTASFARGETIPSQRALADMHGVGQSTVHRALRRLASEGFVRAEPRLGWVRAGPSSEPLAALSAAMPLRIGLLSRRGRAEMERASGFPVYMAIMEEARRRGAEVALVPNQRLPHPTPARNRIELARVPWNEFAVALLVEVEDAITLADQRLKCRPVLAVDQDARDFGLDSVSFDDIGAGRMAARHLFDLGHRRFAVTDEINDPGWPSDSAWTVRRQGFEAAVGRMGGAVHPQWRIAAGRHRRRHSPDELARETARAWSAMPPGARPTALFAVDQSMLPQLLENLARAGIRVPRHLSVVVADVEVRTVALPGSSQPALRLTTVQLDLGVFVRRILDVSSRLAIECRELSVSWQEHLARREPFLATTPAVLVPADSTAPAPGT